LSNSRAMLETLSLNRRTVGLAAPKTEPDKIPPIPIPNNMLCALSTSIVSPNRDAPRKPNSRQRHNALPPPKIDRDLRQESEGKV
jgi:hypothetical protein